MVPSLYEVVLALASVLVGILLSYPLAMIWFRLPLLWFFGTWNPKNEEKIGAELRRRRDAVRRHESDRDAARKALEAIYDGRANQVGALFAAPAYVKAAEALVRARRVYDRAEGVAFLGDAGAIAAKVMFGR